MLCGCFGASIFCYLYVRKWLLKHSKGEWRNLCPFDISRGQIIPSGTNQSQKVWHSLILAQLQAITPKLNWKELCNDIRAPRYWIDTYLLIYLHPYAHWWNMLCRFERNVEGDKILSIPRGENSPLLALPFPCLPVRIPISYFWLFVIMCVCGR